MEKVKGGYTLVELIIAIFISTLLLSVSSKFLVSGLSQYLTSYENNIEYKNFDNCMLNIDNILQSSYIEKIEAEGNKLIITMENGHENTNKRKKVIYLKNNDLMVSTYVDNNSELTSGNNVLLRNVKSFNVKLKENLIYYSIITIKGEIRSRCV